MTDLTKLTITEALKGLKEKKFSAVELTKEYLNKMESSRELNAYVLETPEKALEQAKAADEKYKNGTNGALEGIPLGIKDLFCTRGICTTACSHILDGFVPPYESTVTQKLLDAGAVFLGKLNMDEFAMGGSNETSFYGPAVNPWSKDKKLVAGGSSGGSAAAVAANICAAATGTDTGGSIRQPAAFTGLTGMKPTYGSVSRYGLLAYASSLDQIGPLAHDVRDAAAILEMISGRDHRDSTSIVDEAFDFSDCFDGDVKGMKIGIPSNYYGEGLDSEIKDAILAAAKLLEAQGAIVEEFDMPIIDYAVPAYYIIACAEASSNLSRYDGIKYGHRTKNAQNLIETYYKSRSEGFGTEVKRRIMLGSFVLSSGYFDAYYKKALKVRGLIKKAFDEAYEKYDMILSPVSPTAAYEIGGQISDPIAMYMADIYTVSINLAGLPAISVPCGFTSAGLPIGMQFIGNSFEEKKLIRMADSYQQLTDYHTKRPEIFGKGGAE